MRSRGSKKTPGALRIAHLPTEIRQVALAAYNAGLCPLPPRQDGSNAPIGVWRRYQV
jgi:hypothetical protein